MATVLKGTIDSDVIFSASAATLLEKPLVVDGMVEYPTPYASAAQETITNDTFKIIVSSGTSKSATYYYNINTKKWTIASDSSIFKVKIGDSVTVTYQSSTSVNTAFSGWTNSSIGMTVGTNFNITVSPSLSLKTYTVTISQKSNETITVKNTNASGTSSYTATYSAKFGDTISSSITPASHYIAGTISTTGYTKGYISQAVTITATEATSETRTVTISPTENQTITVTFSNGNTYTSNSSTEVVCTENYGLTFTVSVTPATGFTAGTLHVDAA